MVRNYLDQNILHTYYNLGINGHPNETVTGAYNILCDVIHVQGKTQKQPVDSICKEMLPAGAFPNF